MNLPPPLPAGDRYRPYGPPHWAGPRYEHPNANLILILGVVSLGTGVLGPVVWIMGSRARREIRSSPWYYDSSKVTIGWICGIIATLQLIVLVISFTFFVLIHRSGELVPDQAAFAIALI